MQFEDFDKKIKEAAENHHPAYDEQAWGKMNKLLDKHMPLKEERRRRFILLFFMLFLLLGAGIFYTVQSLVTKEPAQAGLTNSFNRGSEEEDNKKKEKAADTRVEDNVQGKVKESAGQSAGVIDNTTASQDLTIKKISASTPVTLPVTNRPRQDKSATAASSAIKNKPGENDVTPVFQAGTGKKKKKQAITDPLTAGSPVSALSSDKEAGIKDGSANQQQPDPVTAPVADIPENEKISKATEVISQVVSKSEENNNVLAVKSPVTDSAKNKKPSGLKKSSHFFLTLSAGPDASFTPDGKPGPVIAVTGAGIGYLYKERFSIRAGFYNAVKIYSASPADYNPPASFYNYYPFLTKVDANCRVYEIPVSVGYHFGASKNHSWFATASLSSYLMKRETYNYSYKTTAWGTVQQRKFTFYNRNEHIFSVLGFSAGYQRKISNRISFIAEPYFRMPLGGVGYGKVKLNSAGVLFSLAVQPSAFFPAKQKK
jgi:hypothetical protein